LADGVAGFIVRQEHEALTWLTVAFDIHHMATSNTVEGLDDGDRKLATVHLAVGFVSLLYRFSYLGAVSLVILHRSEQAIDPGSISVIQTHVRLSFYLRRKELLIGAGVLSTGRHGPRAKASLKPSLR
jgi:hypothetical protein